MQASIHRAPDKFERQPGEARVKRVLVVGPVPPPEGGIASVLQDIVNSELSLSYQFDLFPRQPSLPEELRTSLQRNVFRMRRFLAFFSVLLRNRYCLVHIHSPGSVFLGTIIFTALAKLARVPVLVHLHGTDWQLFYPKASRFRKMYTRLGLRLPERVLVLYDLWEHEIRQIVPHARVEVLRNLVHDAPPPSHDRIQEVRSRWGIAQNETMVVTVGAVDRRKGTLDILEAAANLADREPDITFVQVGGEVRPGEFAEAQIQRQLLGVERSVVFTGEVPRASIPGLLAAADVFLLPSYSEGMPISILEAMRAGLPIVTTPVASIPQMLATERSRLFIQPGSPDQIVAALITLRHDKDLREDLGRNARAVFEERFEFSRGMEHLKRVYSELADP